MDSLLQGLQPMVYACLVKDKGHQQQLRETTDPFLLKKRLEVFHEEEKRTRMRELALGAYHKILETQEKGTVVTKFRFVPTGDFPEKEYWGCDAFGYGWNLLGQALSGALSGALTGHRLPLESRVVQWLCPLVRHLSACFDTGDPLTRFYHMSVAQMNDAFSLGDTEVEMESVTAEEECILQEEVAFPGSLVHLIRKRLAPMRNAVLQQRMDEQLLEGACRLYSRDVEAPKQVGRVLLDNLRFLYQQKKLPLSSRVLEGIERIQCRRWSEEEVWQAASFVPRSPCGAYEVFHEIDHAQYSPLAPQTRLVFKTKAFRHVLEYVYFWLVLDHIKDEKEAFQRVRALDKWTPMAVQVMMRQAQYECIRRRLETEIGQRMRANPRFRWVLLTAGADICVEVPYDPMMSHALSGVLKQQREKVVRSTEELCRWVAPNKNVTSRDFCRYFAVRRNAEMWDHLFEGVKPEARGVVQKKFFRVLYPKKSNLQEAFLGARVQSPETVFERMEKELSGVFVEFLKTKKTAPKILARLLYDACFPQDVFYPFSRKISLSSTTKRDDFFSGILKYW